MTCIDCGAGLTRKPGPGRPPLRCNECRAAKKYARPGCATTCAICTTPLSGSRKPQGEARCSDCWTRVRYDKPPRSPLLLWCATCGQAFETTRSHQRYCNRECSPWNKRAKSPEARSTLGARHRQIRKAFAILVEQGDERCAICCDPIDPGTPWHLDHTADREGYRGAAHASCNTSEGAVRGHRLRPAS